MPIAAAKGADVIVLDHHLPGRHAARLRGRGEPQPAGRGRHARPSVRRGGGVPLLVEAQPAPARGRRAGPDLMAMLDLVALATVADVAPLRGVNRAFVRQGLTVMARRHRKGLVALRCGAARPAPCSYHLGFVLGPRVNAGGRIGEADLGARLLGHRRSPRRRMAWPNGSTRSTPTGARSRPRARRGPGTGRGARRWTARWSGPPGRAGIPVSWASWPPPERSHATAPPS
jgi:single-stranded-DNA-specific exonuclease